jgi:Na+:H+ antiporter, NhaC family
VALIAATMIAVLIGWRRGHTLAFLARRRSRASVPGWARSLLAAGALIGTSVLSGRLLAMVNYGPQLLSPNYFYATSALMCAVVSASIGSCCTVVGMIGIGLMGIALNMEFDPAITAAAVNSGAYGDMASPLSDSANLAAAMVGVGLDEHVAKQC